MAKNSVSGAPGIENAEPNGTATVSEAPRKSKKNEERSSLEITTPALPGFDSFVDSLAQLYRHSQDGILIENEDRKILFVNSAFCSIFNIDTPPADLIGTDSVTLLRKNMSMLRDVNSYVALTKRIIKEKEHSIANEIELGSGRVFSFDYAPLIYNNIYTGNFWKYLDVTEKATAGRELKRQKQFYEKILNNIPGDIAVFDPAHRYLFLNPEAVRNPEMREWLIGKNDEDYCRYTNKPYNIAETRHVMFARAFSSRQPVEWEERLTVKDGSGEYHLRKMFPVLDAEGEVEMVVGYSTNVTRNKAIIDQAQKSQKR
ncbi:MAG: PAS domain-containing protein, partial [Flavipsychrobacter sp.]|nr:PAS domain-containing protein [Flavipsychrobacter sp.]